MDSDSVITSMSNMQRKVIFVQQVKYVPEFLYMPLLINTWWNKGMIGEKKANIS